MRAQRPRLYAAVGLLTEHISRKDMPGVSPPSYRAHYLLGIAGALAAGLLWLALLDYGWNSGLVRTGRGPEGSAYAHRDSAQAALPGYWIGLIFAPAGALVILAVHRLIGRRSTNI